MAKNVYANGNAIAGKFGGAKVIAAFPDVCNSPPAPPAGPLPIPYPDSSFSKDLKKGSKKVKVGGKPVALQDQSFFKTAPLGDEAATKSFGASLLSHTNAGKTYFGAYSMDVVFEGKKVCRHLDLTTSNHASYPGSTPPFPGMEGMTSLAEARISARLCPCCGKGLPPPPPPGEVSSVVLSGCPAAFGSDDEAQSAEDFYGLNETDKAGAPTPEALDRQAKYRMHLEMKEKHCSCEGEVFPKPPCDVFRAPNSDRTIAIEGRWTNLSTKFKAGFDAKNAGIVERFIAANPGQPKPSTGDRFGKVDHKTPKSAGGCPAGPGNLQPHDLLCQTCKTIDDAYGDWQGNNPEWRAKWRKAFAKTGIKRKTVGSSSPMSWW